VEIMLRDKFCNKRPIMQQKSNPKKFVGFSPNFFITILSLSLGLHEAKDKFVLRIQLLVSPSTYDVNAY